MLEKKSNKRVMVAMSGGVDSSAVCVLLQKQGYEVEGMTMRVYDLPRHFKDGTDEPDFIRSARELAQQLGIRHHVVDVRQEFADCVVGNFVSEYCSGRTPNPCVLCNREFKFRLLAETATAQDCDLMATGHYVRTEKLNGRTYLLMGDDLRKDQSYFLWRVPQSTLARCIFPLGEMQKDDVRRSLDEEGFKQRAQLSESMEICFVESDYRDFLRRNIPELTERLKGGYYVDTAGRRIGTHNGVPFYTVGQRKGLGIALGKPAYVVRLNAEKNTIVLGDEDALRTQAFFAESPEWVDEAEFFSSPDLTVRVRYHSSPTSCRVELLPDRRLLVRTANPVSAVTPGQSAVFYIGKRLVGGSIIASQRGIGIYL